MHTSANSTLLSLATSLFWQPFSKFSDYHRGIQTREQFVGCIRNLQINGEVQSLVDGQPTGDVDLDSCPTT